MNPRARGFTFLELMIVITLLGVLAAVTVPKMGNIFRHGQLEAGTRDLVATLRYARHAAILRGDGVEVRFDPENRKYQMLPVKLDADGQPEEQQRVRRREEKGRFQLNAEATLVHDLPPSVFYNLIHSSAPLTEERSLPRIIFYPDGSATPSKIGLQNSENRAFAIEIYRTTGLASVAVGVPVLPENTPPLYYLPEKISYANMRGEQ